MVSLWLLQVMPERRQKLPEPKEEARTIAEGLKEKVNGENFEAMATLHNDLGDGPVFLGVLNEGFPTDPETIKQFSELHFGDVGGPIEFPMGFAFLKRSKLVRLAGSHVIIAYEGRPTGFCPGDPQQGRSPAIGQSP